MRTETRYSLTSATALALALCVSVTSACSNPGAGIATEGDWAFITGNTYGQRYSTLDQVNADNFEQLEVSNPGEAA